MVLNLEHSDHGFRLGAGWIDWASPLYQMLLALNAAGYTASMEEGCLSQGSNVARSFVKTLATMPSPHMLWAWIQCIMRMLAASPDDRVI